MTDNDQHPEDPGAEISAQAWAERASRLLDSGKIEEARAEATPWLLRISVDGDLRAVYTAAGRSRQRRPSGPARRAAAEFFLKLYETVEDIRYLNAALYAIGSPFVGRRFLYDPRNLPGGLIRFEVACIEPKCKEGRTKSAAAPRNGSPFERRPLYILIDILSGKTYIARDEN